MDIQNKKILFLGDSITEGYGPQDINNVYWKRLERGCGCISVGFGISGTRIARQQKPSHDPREDQYFRSRVASMDAEADVVVVFGGTNDYCCCRWMSTDLLCFAPTCLPETSPSGTLPSV